MGGYNEKYLKARGSGPSRGLSCQENWGHGYNWKCCQFHKDLTL